MDDVTEVTPEQFEEIVRLRQEAQDARERAHSFPMTLAQKLALLARAKDLQEQARRIGK